jgi:hypothetical protein
VTNFPTHIEQQLQEHDAWLDEQGMKGLERLTVERRRELNKLAVRWTIFWAIAAAGLTTIHFLITGKFGWVDAVSVPLVSLLAFAVVRRHLRKHAAALAAVRRRRLGEGLLADEKEAMAMRGSGGFVS